MKALGTKDAWGVMERGRLISVQMRKSNADIIATCWSETEVVPVTITIWANPSPEVEPLEYPEARGGLDAKRRVQ